jgi:ADP-dependent phosphofructokinase/glucokinase
MLDWLDDLFRRFGQDERLGGAPGSMVHTLTRLCHEPNAVIFTVFHSEKQASVYDPAIRMLTADAPHALGTVDAQTYHRVRADRPADPDVRNYPFEFSFPASLCWGPDPAGQLTVTHGPDRLICTAPYLHYGPDGTVRAGDTPAIVERVFQFPGLTGAQRDVCAAEVALGYPYMALTGLQSAPESQRPAIERDLAMLLGKVTIHVELSGARALPWLRTLIPRTISSVGVNDDELPEICKELLGKTASVNARYDSIWALFQDSRALAAAFDLPRLYVHTHVADLVLRRLPVDDRSLAGEILADLFAKKTVVDWLKPQLPAGRQPGIGPKRDGLEALTTFMSQVAGLAGKTLLQWLTDTTQLAKTGYFRVEDGYAAAVIPVAWFYGDLPQAIITTGAGDRTSVVSFVQSGFTQPRPASID